MIGKIIPAALTLAAGAAAAGVAVLKKKNICPICEVKKAVARTDVHIKAKSPYNNGAALTPRWVGQVGTPSATKLMKI